MMKYQNPQKKDLYEWMEYKRNVYARERQHDETHKVSKLLDQNHDTSFYLHHDPERHK
jgi:hypothetical protein